MNDIINDTLELKEIIEESNEYKEYTLMTKKLDDNKEVNELINKIKELQKKVVNKEVKKEETYEEEAELQMLFDKLNSIDEYKKYLESSKKLNALITDVQDKFSKELNDILN